MVEAAASPPAPGGTGDAAPCSKPAASFWGELLRGERSASVWARLVTAVTGLAEGYDLSSISGVLVLIKADIEMSPRQVGLLAGILYFCMAIAAPVGGMLADRLGRRIALAVTYVLLIVGSLTMACAGGFTSLLVGRMLMGCGLGAGIAVCTTYITEVAPKDARGKFVCLEDLFIVLGISLGYLASVLLRGVRHDWRWVLGGGAALASVALALLPQLVESPRWSMLQGDEQRGLADLERLVGSEEKRKMQEQWSQESTLKCTWSEVLCPSSKWRRKALVAACGAMSAQMMTGITIVVVYMGVILAEDFEEEQALRLSFAVACLRVCILTVAIFWVLDTSGRKPLMLSSLAGCGVACVGLTLCYSFEAAAVLKFLFIVLFSMSFSAGMGPVPFVYTAEVIPSDMRSKGMGLAVFISRMGAGLFTLVFPVLRQRYGLDACFASFALANLACFFFVWCFAPESMGRSLEEMHHIFKKTPPSPQDDVSKA